MKEWQVGQSWMTKNYNKTEKVVRYHKTGIMSEVCFFSIKTDVEFDVLTWISSTHLNWHNDECSFRISWRQISGMIKFNLKSLLTSQFILLYMCVCFSFSFRKPLRQNQMRRGKILASVSFRDFSAHRSDNYTKKTKYHSLSYSLFSCTSTQRLT